ncbi:glutamate--tRNA ligase [Candidatus Daviesbacteria bacterium]|nr:glutamate--tRNA ligase [Candidatus Daviesbacteria bacterium]
MTMVNVRVRIAPSPTGSPHIGTAWQALFDYVFAKKHNGKFILRLEDTDRARFVPGSEFEIYETLKWLGFEYNEGPDIGGSFGPYKQSERLDIYKKYSDELLEKGLSFKDEGAVRFRINKSGQASYHDLVGDKDITIQNTTQEDFVILKSDGFPTYNFANVIDDHLMQISHVIRGNEYISSMPKYLQLYRSFNWKPPQFAHLPLLVGSDRSKLSKRHGAKGALEFKKEGFLKEAVINFLALLGWTHPQAKEIFSLDEMIEVFDFKDFNPASAFFDVTKLEWLNGEYIRKTQDSNLKTQIYQYLLQLSDGALSKTDHPTEEEIERLVPLVKERIKKLSDFIPLTSFFYERVEYDQAQFQKLNIKNQNKALETVLKKLEEMEKPWQADVFESTFRKLAEDLGLSASQMFQLIRVAISGQLVTPPLFESIQVLGEEETINRIQAALKFLQ